jgi:outer membrane lipoprotein-sorting protein
LLARLAEPPRPWWRRFGSTRRQVRRPAPGIARLPRRSLLGLAAASALALTAASLSLPLVGTPEVSAREILEKVQANSENPGLAGVKSFHLTAKIWSAGGPKGLVPAGQAGPRELTTEQWFVAPDRMRTETRSQDANGKPVVSGFLMNGSEAKQYSTTGAADVFMISFFAAPVGGKAVPGPQTAGAGVTSPTGSPVAGTAVQVDRREVADGTKSTVVFAVRKSDGEAKPGEEQKDVIIMGENCPEPKRTGEATVAGRAVFVVENDFSACLPANAPDEVRGKHVRWVDQKTYLPLKMESYDVKGALMDRYEVTSIEYDVAIPEKTFTDLPAGTSVREPMMVPALPATKGQFVPAKPAAP